MLQFSEKLLNNLMQIGLTVSLAALVPVSYTHLDVYKRQGFIGGGGLGTVAVNYGYNRYNFPIMLVAVIIIAVSYTHLDVYKRQGHGTEADSNSIYTKMQETLKAAGYDNYFVGTVEATPSLDDVIARCV